MIELAAPLPIGVGTANCEALSSYVQRLAVGNGTFPGQLVHRLLAWLQEGKPQSVGAWYEHPRGLFLGRNINAFGLADIWLRLLRAVLPNQQLVSLSANQWAGSFPTRGFLKSHLTWCPHCLATDTVPYHRLLWTLQPVTHCCTHHAALVDRCPGCKRRPPVVHERSHVGICPWCATDLREGSATEADSINPAAANELGAIVAHFGRTDERPAWRSQQAIRAVAQFAGISNPTNFARAIGTSKLTTWGWWNGSNDISLPFALHAYSQLRASFSSAVIGGSDAPIVPLSEGDQAVFHFRTRQAARVIDWSDVHQRLRAFASEPIVTAPSLLAAAAELGIERRTLRAHFPDLCRTIARRRHQRLATERRRRDQLLRHKLTRAIRERASAALSVNPVDIERYLGVPGLFNRRYARAALRGAFVNLANAVASAKPAASPRWT